MAKPTTRRRAAAQTQDDTGPNDIFAHFEAHGRSLNEGESRAPSTATPEPTADSALLERISRLEGDLAESQRRSMMAQPASQRQAQVGPQDVRLDLTGITDPLEDRERFQNDLATRVNAFVTAREHGIRQELQQTRQTETAAERLWTGFTEQHEEWAPHADLVEAVAVKVTQRAIADGIDPQRFMFQNTPAFYAAVAKELNDKYGRLVEQEEDEGPSPSPAPRQRRSATQEDDDGRTAGVFGGQESGGRAARGAARTPENTPSMIDDLHAMQRKMGLY